MRPALTRFLLIATALILAAVTAWSLKYFGRYQPFADLIRASGGVGLGSIELRVDNAQVVGHAGGHKRWRMSARSVTVRQGHQQVVVDGIQAGQLFDAAGRTLLMLTAGRADYAMPTGAPGTGSLLRVSGGIRATTLRPRRFALQTPALVWDSDRAVVRAPGPLTLTLPGGAGRAVAQNVVYETRTGDLSLTAMRGTFRLPPGVLEPMFSAQRRKLMAGAAGASLLAGAALSAAPNAGTSSSAAYHFGTARWLNAPHTIEVSKGMTVTHEDTTLKTEAAVATLDDEQHLLSAKSLAPVHIFNPQNDLTGQQGTVDFTRRLATLRESITLIVKPDPNTPAQSVRAQFKDAATLTCALMTYDYRRKLGRIPGALTIRQSVRGKPRVLQADAGIYDGKKQTVTLTGNVHGSDPEFGTVKASTVTVGVKEGAEFITIPVPTSGIFPVKDQPEEDAPPPDTAPPAPEPPKR